MLTHFRYAPEHLKPFHEKDGRKSAAAAAASGKKQRAARTTAKATAKTTSGAPLVAAKDSTSFTAAGQQSLNSTVNIINGDGADHSDSSSEVGHSEEEDIFKDIPFPQDDEDDEDFRAPATSPPRTPIMSRHGSPEVPLTRSRKRRRLEDT